MKPARLPSVAAALALVCAGAAQNPPAAEHLLAGARAKAKAEDKHVLVLFHASWCKWCKKLDELLAKPEFKPLFDENFVIVRLTVLERGEKIKQENPGAEEVMAWLGGKGAGLPFIVLTDGEGKTLASSLRPVPGGRGVNTGYPVSPEEVAHFADMLRKGAKRAAPGQIEAVVRYLSAKS